MKKYRLLIILLVLTAVLCISISGCSFSKKTSSNVKANAVYHLSGRGTYWELQDGVLIVDSGKCFFANAVLKNVSSRKITIKSRYASIEERNKNNNTVSYLRSCSKTSTYQEDVNPDGIIELFEGLEIKQTSIHCHDIADNDLYLVFEYKDTDNTSQKEEIKLDKQLFLWN